MSLTDHKLAIDRLRAILATKDTDADFSETLRQRDPVLARFQPIFSTAQVQQLTDQQFRSFLLFDNNRHWSGLNRKGHRACTDMPALRDALELLLDENKPLAHRVNKVADEVPGMGRALITAILLVAYPDRYGVWNGTSEAALKQLQAWPEFERGAGFGERYQVVNQVLLRLASGLGVDLWTLDALFWRVLPDDGSGDGPVPPIEPSPGDAQQRFGLERHLHEFLRDNWDRTTLAKEWALYAEQGEAEAGYEYPTDIGRIDLLAKHRTKRRWLVVELKRGQTSDDTVGQILRYIGWVRRHLADPGDSVEGIIICREADDSLRYAVSETRGVTVQVYEVSFTLRPDPQSLHGNPGM